MNLKQILKISNGKCLNEFDLNKKINKIKINSKDVKKNDIFIAIQGENLDGHNFIEDAINNGACAIIVSKNIKCDIPAILVDDTVNVLGKLASYIKNKYCPITIAITGSTGKTTTRNLIYNLLKSKYNCLTNEKNYNNNIGVPLTIFNLNEKTEILILEMGMNHLNEISYLSNMVNPDISIITNIGSSHIGNLKSKENIFMAKLEILNGMKNKILFINGDDKYLKTIEEVKLIKSGFSTNCDLKAYDIKSNLYSSEFKIKYNNKEYEISVPLPYHLISDVLISINVALYYGIDINNIINILKNYKTYDMRMDIIKNENIIINDCYNSSFESLTGILTVLENENQKKLLILGSIKELGNYSDEIHNKLKFYLDKIKNKEIILIGKEIKNLKLEALYFDNYNECINYLKTKDIKDTIILIKGSRKLKLENITNYFIKKTQ